MGVSPIRLRQHSCTTGMSANILLQVYCRWIHPHAISHRPSHLSYTIAYTLLSSLIHPLCDTYTLSYSLSAFSLLQSFFTRVGIVIRDPPKRVLDCYGGGGGEMRAWGYVVCVGGWAGVV
jgi:hypothetical protein